MKILSILLMIISINAHAYQNEPDGFRGLKWGDELDSNKEEMTLKVESEKGSLYTRKDDSLEIGGAKLESISYQYKRGKLAAVFIKTEGYENKRAIIEAFKAQFGTPIQRNRYIDSFVWRGTTTVTILTCKSYNDTCSVLMDSAKILNEEIQEKKEKALNSGKDF